MRLGGFRRVMRRVQMVRMRHMRVVGGLFVIVIVEVIDRRLVMARGVFVVFSRKPVMFGGAFAMIGVGGMLVLGRHGGLHCFMRLWAAKS